MGGGWVRDAACRVEPYSSWRWVLEPSGGTETASTVVKLFEVCAACPVRRPCLEDALSERSYTVEGIWGGTTRTERRRALRETALELSSSHTIELTDAARWDRATSTSSLASNKGGLAWLDGTEFISEVATRLDSTFEQRLVGCVPGGPRALRTHVPRPKEPRRATESARAYGTPRTRGA